LKPVNSKEMDKKERGHTSEDMGILVVHLHGHCLSSIGSQNVHHGFVISRLCNKEKKTE